LDPFLENLARYQARVEAALDRRLPAAGILPARLHQAMRYATLDGGKRLRAALVYATAEALGAEAAGADVPAASVELIHAYSLVHDDLPSMDDDDLRRGKPTCHKVFGEAMALLAGDALQSLAFELLAGDPALAVAPEVRLEMLHRLARAAGAAGMAGGQAIDLEAVGRTLSLPELENMHIHKTGALIRTAVGLGVLYAGAGGTARAAALDEYAKCLGLAFQIHDDILDVEGDAEVMGKTGGADRARDKPTYPALLGLAEAKAAAREWCQAALASLGPLGDNGWMLRRVAEYAVTRNR